MAMVVTGSLVEGFYPAALEAALFFAVDVCVVISVAESAGHLGVGGEVTACVGDDFPTHDDGRVEEEAW